MNEKDGIEVVSSETITESKEKQVLPEKDLKAKIEKDLQSKVDTGENLSEKTIYTRVFNEIAEKNGCSYQYVYGIAKTYLKKKKETVETSAKSEGNKIKIKTVNPDERPKREVVSDAVSTLQKREPATLDEASELKIKFESEIIEMSFQSIADIEKLVGLPAPQAKKIKRIASTIALYNESMTQAGTPEKCINVGERLLPIFIKLSIASMFIMPIAQKFMGKDFGNKKKSEDGIEEIHESQRRS